VPSKRLARMLELLAADGSDDPSTRRLAEVSAQFTKVSGAGIMLMSGDIQRGAVGVSDDVAGLIEELQYTLGEGPCVDAYHQDFPIMEPDLAVPDEVRWTAFTPPAVRAGVRSIFGFPLRVGGARLGALNLYCNYPGPLSDDQHLSPQTWCAELCSPCKPGPTRVPFPPPWGKRPISRRLCIRRPGWSRCRSASVSPKP